MKELFVIYDTEKKGVTLPMLQEIMKKLIADECIIGKVPNMIEDEIEGLFEPWKITDEEKCTWHRFRDGLNTWLWKMQDRERL